MPNLLVIPSIDLVGSRCTRCIRGVPGTETLYADLSDNPVELAQLWRRENAKCIHVTDVASFAGITEPATFDKVVAMQKAVDIPIQFVSMQNDLSVYRTLLERGVYRVAINILAITEPDLVRGIIDDFGPSRVIFGIRAHNGDVDLGAGVGMMSDEEYILHVFDLGGRRVIYTETDWEGHLTGESMDTVRRIAAVAPMMRITTAGGIASAEHLWEIQRAAPRNVDSVVIGRALYENRFPCQAIWRMAEARLEPDIHAHARDIVEQSSISGLERNGG